MMSQMNGAAYTRKIPEMILIFTPITGKSTNFISCFFPVKNWTVDRQGNNIVIT